MKRFSLTLILALAFAVSANAQWTIQDVTPPIMSQAVGANALAWGDVDNNGYPDLFVGALSNEGCHLFLGSRDGWRDASASYEVENIRAVQSAQWVDYNRDGRLDLLCVTLEREAVQLYRQLESGRMQAVNIGINQHPVNRVTSAGWCDLDNDGSLELLLNSDGRRSPELTILQQIGEIFAEVRGPMPEGFSNLGVMSQIDYDRDGDLDLITGMREGSRCRFFENAGGSYRDLSDVMSIPRKMMDKGATWADFDNNGELDCFTFGDDDYTGFYYQTNNHGARRFTNKIRGFGLSEIAGNAVDACAVDANNDGWTDLMIVRRDADYTYILINEHGTGWSGGWIEPPYFGESDHQNYACAWADFDNDGDRDYALSLGADGVRLYENNPPHNHEWIAVDLFGNDINTPQINCRLMMEFEHGIKQWASTSSGHSGAGYNGTSLLVVNSTEIKSSEARLHVYWSDGSYSVYPIAGEDIGTTITLHQPQIGTIEDTELPNVDLTPIDLGNNPNPFNPTTTINFTIPTAGFARLAVYNLLGQEVAQLTNNYYEAGTHSLHWDASMLPSGLYFARLEASGESLLHRMLLTK